MFLSKKWRIRCSATVFTELSEGGHEIIYTACVLYINQYLKPQPAENGLSEI